MDLFETSLQYLDIGYILTISLVCTVLILHAIRFFQYYSGTPPGPWGVPILGYLPFMNTKAPNKHFMHLAKKYGDVFSLKLGQRNVIVFNGADTIKQALAKYPAFDGRSQDGIDCDVGFEHNVATTDGNLWRSQRTFLLRALRDFGSGKSPMEDYIHKEAEFTMEKMKKNSGSPVDVSNMMKQTTCNIIAYVIFGRRFADHEDVSQAVMSITDVLDGFDFMGMVNSFPIIMKHAPNWMTGMNFLKNCSKVIFDVTEEIIKEHEKTFDENNLRDLIDWYIWKQRETEEKDNIIFSKTYMRSNINGLFAAGVDTTAIVLSWAVRILAAHPEVQKKVQAELDEVVGRERFPTMRDKRSLPYTEATIQEIHRYSSLAALTAFHRATEEVMFNGYRIPKDSCLMFNLWSINRSTELWDNPEKFDPERFLTKDGKLSSTSDLLIPFLIGKRSCLGEIIAKMEIFLFITIFMQNYTFTLPKNEVWKMEPDSFAPMTKCYTSFVCITPRK